MTPIIEQPLGERAEKDLQTIGQFKADEVLLDYQKRWIADDSDVKIAEKSRRTGLTWAEAADAALCAGTARNQGGCNHFYVGSNKEMAREFIEAVAMWSKAFHKAAGEITQETLFEDDGREGREILIFVVYFSSGFKVQALSSNPSNLRGMQGNVTIDEAAFHDRLAEVLKAALALTMWGSKVRLISTHNGYENLFNELINDSRSGKKRYSVHRITLHDACKEGLYQRICQINDKAWSLQAEQEWIDNLMKDTASKEDAEEEYFCVPKHGSGSYLSRMIIEARTHHAPVFRFHCTAEFNSWPEHLREAEINDWCNTHLLPILKTLNPTLEHCFGEDFARVSDLTVIAPMAVEQTLKRTVPFLVELFNMPYHQQRQILLYITTRLPRLRGGALDNRGNGGYLAEQAAEKHGNGIIEKVDLSQSWYLNNMPRFKSAFEDGSIAIPNDADVVADLQAIKLIKGVAKVPDVNTSTIKGKNRHGDAAIALSLAYYASLMDTVAYEYTAVLPVDRKNDNDYVSTSRYGSERGIL
ncbi:MAG: terminase family protein [Pseudomonadota bacterium]